MNLVKLVSEDVEQAVERFEAFHKRLSRRFATKTRNMSVTAKQYLHGQLTCQKRGNLMQFEKVVPQSNQQSMHHLLSNSAWDEPGALDDIAATVSGQVVHHALVLEVRSARFA